MNNIKAAMEFCEPGSTLTMEQFLEAFASLATGTKKGSFYITKNVRTKKWRIQLTAVRKSFIGDDLRKILTQAVEYILTHTEQRESDKFLVEPNH